MIDFTLLDATAQAYKAAVAALDAVSDLGRMHTDRWARELMANIETETDTPVVSGKGEGWIKPDQAREVLRTMLPGMSPEVRAEAESVLGSR